MYEDKEEELKKKAIEKKRKAAEAKAKDDLLKKQWEDECVHKLANKEEVDSFEDWKKAHKKKQEEEEKKKKKEEERIKRENAEARRKQLEKERMENASDDDDDGEKLSKEEQQTLRGYKTTSDGRTTSYFNREISEEEKRLIGNVAPQRIQTELSSDVPIPSSNTPTRSAWNSAQTWEERDTTEWCTAALKTRLNDATAASEQYRSVITAVKNISGEASFAISNGKKRYIFDYSAELKFHVKEQSEDCKVASGTLKLVDVCSGTVNDGDYGIEFGWSKAPEKNEDVVTNFCRNELLKSVRASVQNFVQDFSEHYS